MRRSCLKGIGLLSGLAGGCAGILLADLALGWVGWDPPHPTRSDPGWLRLFVLGVSVALGFAAGVAGWVVVVRRRRLLTDEEILRILGARR